MTTVCGRQRSLPQGIRQRRLTQICCRRARPPVTAQYACRGGARVATTRSGRSTRIVVTTIAAAQSMRNALPERIFPAITSKTWHEKSWAALPM